MELSSILGVSIVGFIFLIFVIPYFLYSLTLFRTLSLVSHDNQKISPLLVWLFLIPIAGRIFYVILIVLFSESLKLEFGERGIYGFEDKPGFTIGLTSSILMILSLIPIIGILFGIAGFVCWIIHWVKVVEFKKVLKQSIEDDYDNGNF
jgi:hypothetical protein